MVNYKGEVADMEAVNAHVTIDVTYRRESYAITLRLEEQSGALIDVVELSVPVGESFAITANIPEIPYFTYIGDKSADSAILPTEDKTFTLTYSTDAYLGFKAVGDICTTPKSGNTYLIYNAKNETSRSGFLGVGGIGENITTTNGLQQGNMTYVWQLQAAGDGYKVANGLEGYIPAINKGGKVAAAETGDVFTFTLNADATSFSIKGTNDLYWNGNADNTFTGWTDGHPFILYNYFVEPYFCVTVECVDEQGAVLQRTESYHAAGESYVLVEPTIKGYTFSAIESDVDALTAIDRHIHLTLRYTTIDTAIEHLTTCPNDAVYRLNGTKAHATSQGEIVIVGNKKQLQK